jgi:hypothetical protein
MDHRIEMAILARANEAAPVEIPAARDSGPPRVIRARRA